MFFFILLHLIVQISRSLYSFCFCSFKSTMPPKTPRHRSRSETKIPLTPSLVASLNTLSFASPTKGKADLTNPFIASRPASPIKRATTGVINVSDSLQKQASGGVIRKGGVESRLDVITRDYVPPKSETKRSRSQPTVSYEFLDDKSCMILNCLTTSYRGIPVTVLSRRGKQRTMSLPLWIL